jgi:hypothetical protein
MVVKLLLASDISNRKCIRQMFTYPDFITVFI